MLLLSFILSVNAIVITPFLFVNAVLCSWLKKKESKILSDNGKTYADYATNRASIDIGNHYNRQNQQLAMFFDSDDFKNRKFNQYGHKQQAMDELLNRITRHQDKKLRNFKEALNVTLHLEISRKAISKGLLRSQIKELGRG